MHESEASRHIAHSPSNNPLKFSTEGSMPTCTPTSSTIECEPYHGPVTEAPQVSPTDSLIVILLIELLKLINVAFVEQVLLHMHLWHQPICKSISAKSLRMLIVIFV